jgi:hypothetical protein
MLLAKGDDPLVPLRVYVQKVGPLQPQPVVLARRRDGDDNETMKMGPCKFCGGESAYTPRDLQGEPYARECTQCGAVTETFTMTGLVRGMRGRWATTSGMTRHARGRRLSITVTFTMAPLWTATILSRRTKRWRPAQCRCGAILPIGLVASRARPSARQTARRLAHRRRV